MGVRMRLDDDVNVDENYTLFSVHSKFTWSVQPTSGNKIKMCVHQFVPASKPTITSVTSVSNVTTVAWTVGEHNDSSVNSYQLVYTNKTIYGSIGTWSHGSYVVTVELGTSTDSVPIDNLTYGHTYTFYIVKNTTFFNQTQIIQSDDFDRPTGGSEGIQSLDDNMPFKSDIYKFLPNSNILVYKSLSEDEFYYAVEDGTTNTRFMYETDGVLRSTAPAQTHMISHRYYNLPLYVECELSALNNILVILTFSQFKSPNAYAFHTSVSNFFLVNTTIALGTGSYTQGYVWSVSSSKYMLGFETDDPRIGTDVVKFSMFIDDAKLIMYRDEGTVLETVYRTNSPEFWNQVDQNGGNVKIAGYIQSEGGTFQNLKVANYNPWVIN